MEAWLPTLLGLGLLGILLTVPVVGWVIVRSLGRSGGAQSDDARAAIAWQGQARSALDVVPDWVILVRDDIVTDSNTPRRTPFERAGPKSIGRPLIWCYPKGAAEQLHAHIGRAIEGRRPLIFEFLYDDGSRYAEARVFPLNEELALVVTRDVTEQKSKEEVLHRSKERFALAVQGANDGLWDWDLATEEVYYSYQWKSIVGVDPAEISNASHVWFDRVHEEDIGGLKAALGAHLRGEAPRFESEHRIRGPGGRWLWVLARGMAVRDANGEAKRIAGSLTDLTNRRVVAVTKEKADLLLHATESVGIGIAVLAADGTLDGAGEQLRAMTGEWRTLTEWWLDVSREHPAPDPIPCPSCGKPAHIGTVLAEVYRPTTDAIPIGSTDLMSRVFEVTWTGHAHEIGDDDAHVLLVKDATDRVRAERRLFRANEELVVARDEALAASRSKSTFLANMSHELRTPLNHIIGYTEMVSEELADLDQPELVADLDKVRGSGAHLLDLITGILDLSRIEAGISNIELQSFDLHKLVQQVAERWQPDIERKRNQLVLAVEPDLGQMLANEQQVRRILDALVSNAAKFTDNGSITVSAEPHFRGGREWIVIAVQDTGMGMSPDVVRRLFADFAMGDESSTREHGGAGLGLTLARRFTDMQGGAIDVSSKQGEGSTFRVTLPREVSLESSDEDDETAEVGLPS